MKTKKVSPDVFRLNHLPALGMTSVEQYMQWCKVNGFSPTTNKSKQELKAEKDHYTRVLADNALRFSSRSLTTKKFLQKIVKGEYRADANAYKYRKNTSIDTCEPEFAAFLLIVEEASDLLESSRYLPKLHSLFSWRKDWIRKPENWTTNTHNCDRQFSQLSRFLLTKYDVPVFMDTAWETGDQHYKEQFWFIHIGMGENIRTALDLPIPLTKSMAHHFLQAPDNFPIDGAFLWAEVHSEKGNSALVRALVNTTLSRDHTNHEFRKAAIRFFVANPMLDSEQIGPICDYVWHMKFGMGGDPEQPGFTFTGRNVESLIKQVETWHRRLGRAKKTGNVSWPHMTSAQDFEFVEGMGKTEKVWRIKQILTAADLHKEGQAMHHCVSSYSYSCARGTTSIWSLTMQDNTGNWRMLTLEVRNKMITQMRGLYNRPSTPKEVSILSRWTSTFGIGRATYL